MNDVTKLPIYKSLLPRIRKQDRAEFKRMLQLACDEYEEWFVFTKSGFGMSKGLYEAFWWAGTPQGYDYWHELRTRLLYGGHGDVA